MTTEQCHVLIVPNTADAKEIFERDEILPSNEMSSYQLYFQFLVELDGSLLQCNEFLNVN